MGLGLCPFKALLAGAALQIPSDGYSQFTLQVLIPNGPVRTGKLGSTGQQPERSRRAMPPLLGQDSILSSVCLWDLKGIFSYFSARQRGKKNPQYFVVVYTGRDKSFQYLLYLDVFQPQS